MRKRILLIEDDEDLAHALKIQFGSRSMDVSHFAKGAPGLEAALAGDYALVILDWFLPDMEGIEVCREIRARKSLLPILMLTSRSEDLDKVVGFEVGADDYLTKPFEFVELFARVKSLIRRFEEFAKKTNDTPIETKELQVGDIRIDIVRRQVFLREEELNMTAQEFELITYLASSPGRVFSRLQLLRAIWQTENENYDQAVNSAIKRIRNKIENDPVKPKYIVTVRGYGYKFAEQSDFED